MNILYAADEKFAPIMIVSIKTLCDKNCNLKIYILDSGISEINKIKIRGVAKGSEVNFIAAVNILEMYKVSMKNDRGSVSQFSRLFIQEVIPEEITRILYLDCDTLICDNLDELYETDLGGKIVGGVLDAMSLTHIRQDELEPKDVYINSGVMLIDVAKWRENETETKILQKIYERRGRFLQGDQGIINMVLKGKIKKLPIRYNMVTYNFDFSYKDMMFYRKPYKYYTESQVLEGKKHPAIVHFTTSFASLRPWQTDFSIHPFYNKWMKVYCELGFQSQKQKLGKLGMLYNTLPHKIVLRLFRILHVYIKPFIY